MFTYYPSTSFTGWNLGLENYSIYIGVPKKYLFAKQGYPRRIQVEYNGDTRIVSIEDQALEKEQIQQLDTPMPHILIYFKWEDRDENSI
jgi:hypothetical protein